MKKKWGRKRYDAILEEIEANGGWQDIDIEESDMAEPVEVFGDETEDPDMEEAVFDEVLETEVEEEPEPDDIEIEEFEEFDIDLGDFDDESEDAEEDTAVLPMQEESLTEEVLVVVPDISGAEEAFEAIEDLGEVSVGDFEEIEDLYRKR